jgi:hypothetical protein
VLIAAADRVAKKIHTMMNEQEAEIISLKSRRVRGR